MIMTAARTFPILMLMTIPNTIVADFDCTDRRCCIQTPSADPTNIDCESLSLSMCLQVAGCGWDCTPTNSRLRNAALRDAGYTRKRFLRVSKGDGDYREPRLTEDGPPLSLHNEPSTADEMQRWTRITSIDECGVVYEYEMDTASAQHALERLNATAPKLNEYLTQQERLVRRLTVFGNDGRVKVTNKGTQQWAGYLQFSTKGGDEKRCTATLVTSNFVITAGHCVHSGYGPGINPEWFHNWRFYPGLVNENQMSALEITGLKAYAFSEWTSHYGPNWDYDIALIELNTIDAKVSPLSIGHDSGIPDGVAMTTVGYPGDMSWLTKWSQVCTWNYVLDEFMVSDTCDIAPGSSGSPVYKYHSSSGKNVIFCIVSWENDHFNGCARITSSKYGALCSWLGCK